MNSDVLVASKKHTYQKLDWKLLQTFKQPFACRCYKTKGTRNKGSGLRCSVQTFIFVNTSQFKHTGIYRFCWWRHRLDGISYCVINSTVSTRNAAMHTIFSLYNALSKLMFIVRDTINKDLKQQLNISYLSFVHSPFFLRVFLFFILFSLSLLFFFSLYKFPFFLLIILHHFFHFVFFSTFLCPLRMNSLVF